MKNNPNEIDNKYEAFVAGFKTALRKQNFWKVSLWLLMVSMVLTAFFASGGLQVILELSGIKGAGK